MPIVSSSARNASKTPQKVLLTASGVNPCSASTLAANSRDSALRMRFVISSVKPDALFAHLTCDGAAVRHMVWHEGNGPVGLVHEIMCEVRHRVRHGP